MLMGQPQGRIVAWKQGLVKGSDSDIASHHTLW